MMDLLIVWRCLFSVPCLFMMFLDDFVGASLCSFVKGASPCILFGIVDVEGVEIYQSLIQTWAIPDKVL